MSSDVRPVPDLKNKSGTILYGATQYSKIATLVSEYFIC